MFPKLFREVGVATCQSCIAVFKSSSCEVIRVSKYWEYYQQVSVIWQAYLYASPFRADACQRCLSLVGVSVAGTPNVPQHRFVLPQINNPLKSSYGVWGSSVTLPAGSGAHSQSKSNSVHFSFKMWHLVTMYFDDFPENQLTKFRAV